MDDHAVPAFASSVGQGGDWASAAKHCLENLLLVPGANLGLLYVSDHLADQMGSIATLLRGVTGVRDWVGTAGLGVVGTGVELFDRPAISVLIGRFPEGQFAPIPALTDGLEPLNSLRPWLRDHAAMLTLIHGDPRHARMPMMLVDLAGATGGFVVGGLTASRGEQAVLSTQGVAAGLSGMVFSADVPVATGLTQGCIPIGPVHTITACDNHVVMQIDGRPALEVLKADIGSELSADLRQLGGLIFAGLPIMGDDRGDRLVRNLTAIDLARGWIAIGEKVADGQAIVFCRRDADAARTDMLRMLTQIQRRLSGPPRAGVYISCVARGPGLFGNEQGEIAMIHQHLGDFPLTGFFAGGEISNAQLYGYTGVLILFL